MKPMNATKIVRPTNRRLPDPREVHAQSWVDPDFHVRLWTDPATRDEYDEEMTPVAPDHDGVYPVVY